VVSGIIHYWLLVSYKDKILFSFKFRSFALEEEEEEEETATATGSACAHVAVQESGPNRIFHFFF
jgi:hypothetical protein